MAMARTSLLEAVNRVLQMMGEAPVNSLQGQFPLAKQAQDAITDVSRKLQAEGWSFNTDYERTLVRDNTNQILVGDNVSRVVVDPYLYPSLDVVQRGAKLYDRRNKSYTFTTDLVADVTYILEWDELPEHARQFITVKSGRQLQEAIVSSSELTRLNLTLELEARSQFLEEETTKSEHSMLRGNPNHTGVLRTYLPSRAIAR
ncbi:MAG: hypothetical protein ACO28M_10955 [Vulcanococcus sp.]